MEQSRQTVRVEIKIVLSGKIYAMKKSNFIIESAFSLTFLQSLQVFISFNKIHFMVYNLRLQYKFAR